MTVAVTISRAHMRESEWKSFRHTLLNAIRAHSSHIAFVGEGMGLDGGRTIPSFTVVADETSPTLPVTLRLIARNHRSPIRLVTDDHSRTIGPSKGQGGIVR